MVCVIIRLLHFSRTEQKMNSENEHLDFKQKHVGYENIMFQDKV